MRHSRTKRAAQGGFTLVELLVAAALLIVAFGSIAMIGGVSERAYRTGTVVSHLESRVAITMERIVTDLRTGAIDSLDPDPVQGVGSRNIQYVQATGLELGEVQWSETRELLFEYEGGELDDGIDNNGNGLIDEGCLVLVEDLGGPREHRRVMTRWVAEFFEGDPENGLDDNGNGLVDENGFFVERLGETLIIRLTLQQRTSEGQLITRTARSSVKLRNRLDPEGG